jgi:hypothetical protein
LDDLKIWKVKADEEAAGWKERRSAFPKFEPVQLKEPKAKSGKAS